MNMKRKKTVKFLPAALLAAPLIVSNISSSMTSALEGKSIYNIKLLILNQGNYEEMYDTNSNGSVDVFDIIRIKQKQYGTGSCGLVTEPAVTTEVSVSEIPVSSDITSDVTSESLSVSTSDITAETSDIAETSAIADTSVTTSVSVSSVISDVSETSGEETPVTTELTTTHDSEPVTASGSVSSVQPYETDTVTASSEIITTSEAVTTTTEAVTTTTVTTTEAPPVTTVITTTPAPVTTIPDRKIISSVKSFVQGPELPTGCEATGLTIAVRWYGYDVGKVEMAMTHMPRQDFRYSGSRLIGADFMTTFAGDPSREEMSYGCYIPCMVKTVNNYFSSVGSSYRGRDISGKELEELFPYVAQNIPVILISTPELVTPRTGDSWYTNDGRYVTWQRGHHCMVLIGYDKKNGRVYCADPMMRAGIVSWNIAEFRNIYNLKGKNAMIIDTGSVTVPKTQMQTGDIIRFCGWANSSSDGKGSEVFLDTNLYTITRIIDNKNLPNPVCIGNIGWVSLEAAYENIPYFGDGSPAPDDGFPVSSGKVYNIVNELSGKYLNVDYGKDNDGTNIYQWSNDGSTEQKFKVSGDENSFRIMAMCSSSGGNRMVTASRMQENVNVHLWQKGDTALQEWMLRKTDSGAWCIALKASPDYVLTVADGSNGSASGTGSTSAGNVFISKYSGSRNQLWRFFPR